MKHAFNSAILLATLTLLTACGNEADTADLPTGTAPSATPVSDEQGAEALANAEEAHAEAETETVVAEQATPDQPPLQPDPEASQGPRVSLGHAFLGGGGPGPFDSRRVDFDVADIDPLPFTQEDAGEPADEPERSAIPGLTYILPEGWAVGPEQRMRRLTLVPPAEDFPDAELSVFLFPGDVGGFSSNVLRWAGQLGINFIQPPQRSHYQTFDMDGVPASWIPLVAGGENARAILAIWAPIGEDPDQPEQTWTFKLNCRAQDAEALSPILRAWAESVEFEDE